MKIGIAGCAGRMGKALINEVLSHTEVELVAGTVRAEEDALGKDLGVLAGMEPIGVTASCDAQQLFQLSDVVIDFTVPENTIENAKHACHYKKALVTGTTGLTQTQRELLVTLAANSPIVWSANMSVGVNLLQKLVEKVSSILSDDYDIEIVEMHHRHKVDSPSGTALMLGEAAAAGRKVALDSVACKARDGIVGKRPQGEIGFATLRGGDVVGDHTVIFAADGERIELSHKASSRQVFAKGAVRAALWAGHKKPGFYSMHDVLGV
jgi:4-hydroxy-tetrahydrodipicolinate reductase